MSENVVNQFKEIKIEGRNKSNSEEKPYKFAILDSNILYRLDKYSECLYGFDSISSHFCVYEEVLNNIDKDLEKFNLSLDETIKNIFLYKLRVHNDKIKKFLV